MTADNLARMMRRYPLVGRARPVCPDIATRIMEVVQAVEHAHTEPDRVVPHSTHALNKAALIASDAGLSDLAAALCWLHIGAYCGLHRPLTYVEVQYLLEPVVNLARLQIRNTRGDNAVAILTSMQHAVDNRDDLTIDGQTLPTRDATGESSDRRTLREWVWLQVLIEGIRALTLAGRWDDAVTLATANHGIGSRLLEGRQAVILAKIHHRDLEDAHDLLRSSQPMQPWEHQAQACLIALCATMKGNLPRHQINEAYELLTDAPQTPEFVTYRCRVRLAIADLAAHEHPDIASAVLNDAAQDALITADGYAARDLRSEPLLSLQTRESLQQIAANSGLGQPAETIASNVSAAAANAAEALATALRTAFGEASRAVVAVSAGCR